MSLDKPKTKPVKDKSAQQQEDNKRLEFYEANEFNMFDAAAKLSITRDQLDNSMRRARAAKVAAT